MTTRKIARLLSCLVALSPLGLPAFAGRASEIRADGALRLYAPAAGASAQNPAFSPDGGTVLFTLFHEGYNDGPAGLYLLSLLVSCPSGDPVALLDEPDQDSVNLPGSSWNAATGRITFASDRRDNDEVWTMAADGSDLRRVTHTAAGYAIEPSFSPDGRWIVFEIDTEAPEPQQQGSIWAVRADGTGLRRVPPAKVTDGPGAGTDDRQPNWSPRGDRILFQRRTPGSDDWNLFTMAPDGSDLQPVITAPSSDTDASWSPDGERIVFSSDYGGLGTPNLFVVAAAGGTPLRVTRDAAYEDGAPSWSGDGEWIAFESHLSQDEETPAGLWRIRAPSTPGGPECVPDPQTLCLHGGRFRVTVSWEDFQGHTGKGRVAPVSSSDSGLFWFFALSNWEMLVKVLDGCGVNDHYWIFSAATTNVAYTLTVEDTRSGRLRSYANALGVSASANTDTGAFNDCS
ncbi:MAG: hypothetical protein GY856_08245 [bacterium]|nr:hypothetical protein [bacterium]